MYTMPTAVGRSCGAANTNKYVTITGVMPVVTTDQEMASGNPQSEMVSNHKSKNENKASGAKLIRIANLKGRNRSAIGGHVLIVSCWISTL